MNSILTINSNLQEDAAAKNELKMRMKRVWHLCVWMWNWKLNPWIVIVCVYTFVYPGIGFWIVRKNVIGSKIRMAWNQHRHQWKSNEFDEWAWIWIEKSGMKKTRNFCFINEVWSGSHFLWFLLYFLFYFFGFQNRMSQMKTNSNCNYLFELLFFIRMFFLLTLHRIQESNDSSIFLHFFLFKFNTPYRC